MSLKLDSAWQTECPRQRGMLILGAFCVPCGIEHDATTNTVITNTTNIK